MTEFKVRSTQTEQIDDPAIVDERLTDALDQLRVVGRRLGGYSSLMSILGPQLAVRRGLPTRILDVGAGMGDFAEYLMVWATRQRLDVHVTAIDLNPRTVAHAGATLDRRLPHFQRDRIKVETANALDLPYPVESFDFVVSSLFLHHLSDADAVIALQNMNRVSRHGVIISDLHRSRIAYHGFKAIAALLNMAPMIRNDGPISVLRGFSAKELRALAVAANLPSPKLSWKWAYRWVLSSIR